MSDKQWVEEQEKEKVAEVSSLFPLSLNDSVKALLSLRQESVETALERARSGASPADFSVVQPYDNESELYLLASLMAIDGGACWIAAKEKRLQPIHFFGKKHALVYEAIDAVFSEGARAADAPFVARQLNQMGNLERVGGYDFLAQVAERGASGAYSVANWAQLIVEKYRIRRMAQELTASQEHLRRGLIDGALRRARSAIELGEGEADPSEGLSDSVQEWLDNLPANNQGQKPGLTTGFADVDRMFRLCPQDFIVVAGRPSMGKSQLVFDMLVELSIKRPYRSLLFSLEMSETGVIGRMGPSLAGVPETMYRVELKAEESSALQNAAGMLSSGQLRIVDKPVSISDIETIARREAREGDLRFIAVDYIQLVPHSGRENQATEIGRISQGLKRLAKELNVTVFGISQLSRAVDSRADKRPMMSDLRDSGCIEQDADIILFPFRREYYLGDKVSDEERGVCELIVAKNRNGKTGSVDLRWNDQIPRFENLARDEDWF